MKNPSYGMFFKSRGIKTHKFTNTNKQTKCSSLKDIHVFTTMPFTLFSLAIFGHLWPSANVRPIVASGVSLKRTIKI